MVEEGPGIYVFDGDDEFAIDESIAKIRGRLGDSNIADMNTTWLDGKACTLAQLEDATATMPFLAPKRLVILAHPTARLMDKSQQEKFINFLCADKPAAKLVLVDYSFLTSDKDRREGRLHWLEKWALAPEQANHVYLRHHPQPSAVMMTRWIQEHARTVGGQFTPQAAVSLAKQIGDDTRLAAQEIIKLLTYVNFTRPVDADDVEHLTPLSARIGDFDLVNALRDRDGRKAQSLLQRSLAENDSPQIFQSIVTQVRSLLVAREILNERGTVNDFPKSLKISYYPARLALESAHRFSIEFLASIYHRLLELDEAIKTSQIDADLALEFLVIELTL